MTQPQSHSLLKVSTTPQQSLNNNLQKLNYFISTSDRTLPILKHSENIAQLLQTYFDDDHLLIGYQQTSVLHQEFFVSKMTQLHKQFLNYTQNSKQRSFVDFIEYWISKDQKLKVYYPPFDHSLEQAATKDYMRQAMSQVQQNTISSQQITNTPVLYHKQSKITVDFDHPNKKTKKEKTGKQLVQSHLQILHDHYCRKIIKMLQGSTFQALKKTFHTMNLTQWMCFIKEFGLLNFHSSIDQQKMGLSKRQSDYDQTISSQLCSTSTPLDTNQFSESRLGKDPVKKVRNQKLNPNFFKNTFQKYCKQFVLDVQAFQVAVCHILKYIVNRDELSDLDFSLLGINDEKSFKKVAERVGIYIPKADIIFRTPPIKETCNFKATKQNDISKLPALSQSINIVPTIPPYTRSHPNLSQSRVDVSKIQPHKKFYRTRQQKKQAELLGKLNINNLNKVKISKDEQAQLWSLIGNGDSIEDISNHNSNNNNKKSNGSSHLKVTSVVNRQNSGLLDRIDSRINNMMKKVK